MTLTSNGSLNFTCNILGLLKMMQVAIHETCPNQEILLLHCIIHKELLWKTLSNMNHEANTVWNLWISAKVWTTDKISMLNILIYHTTRVYTGWGPQKCVHWYLWSWKIRPNTPTTETQKTENWSGIPGWHFWTSTQSKCDSSRNRPPYSCVTYSSIGFQNKIASNLKISSEK
jgi:hypothetical protein